MPRYAIVAVVDAQEPEEAWLSVSERLLGKNRGSITYVGAPWLIQEDTGDELAEFETDGIQLRLDGKRVTLDPID
jgi:hypothetical protein